MTLQDSAFDAVTLDGRLVRLEPLIENHKNGLCQAVTDGELWKLFYTFVPHPDNMDAFIDNANQARESGHALAFAIIDKASNKIAGATRFMEANLTNKRVEIGNTFLGKSFQKTKVNSEAKLLLLDHAFETLKLNRVEFKTDYLNNPSRDAILRLGAKQEGILRSEKVMPDGRVRDSVMFSIIKHEWPGVKQNLEHRLARSKRDL